MSARRDQRIRAPVLGAPIDVIDESAALHRIFDWASSRQSRVVCCCNVHSVVSSGRDRAFAHAITSADLVTPDGAPVAWVLRRQGHLSQQHIPGPDLMAACLARAATMALPVAFIGGSEATLAGLCRNSVARWPGLHIAAHIAPPFRSWSAQEDDAMVAQLNASGARLVFVGLGCPKQELWMAAHRAQVRAVMLGVGAAFDFHAGTLQRAPRWMQRGGLEWLHRLGQEPARLWWRYLDTNSAFVARYAWTWLRQRLKR